MALTLPFKALALVVFLAAVAGATYGVQVYLGDTVGAQLVTVDPLREQLNVSAGQEATYAVFVINRGEERDLAVELSADLVEARSESRTVANDANATFFVTLAVPEDASAGDVPLTLRLVEPSGAVVREEAAGAMLRVIEPPAEGFADGDTARVIYTGRLTDTGRVFNTNDPSLAGKNFPETDSYRFSSGLLPVSSEPRRSVVDGFYEGVLGMVEGESLTISFSAEKGYGPATVEETSERTEELERRLELPLESQEVARATFDQHVESTGQARAFGAGDTFVVPDRTNEWTYEIVTINETVVEYRLSLQEGDSYTIFEWWPGATEVVEANETSAVFFTTPTTGIGEAFTRFAYWENMTAVTAVNDTHITLTHSPPEGHRYEIAGGFGQQTSQYTVKELREDAIVVTTPSTNPLAGRALTFDVLLVEIEE